LPRRGRAGEEQANQRHCRLLRPHCERQCSRAAAEQGDELTPPQVDHATTSQWADHGIVSLQ